jgi:mitochondrial import inner membrane translocase subunit TIM17
MLLAVIEGVGIGFQRMMAENTRLDVRSTRTSTPLQFANQLYEQVPLPPQPPPSEAGQTGFPAVA